MGKPKRRVARGAVLILLLCLGGSAAAQELAGEWVLTIDTPRGVQHPRLVVTNDGDGYSGVYHSLRGPVAIETISFDGRQFEFPLRITVPIGEIEVNYRGAIEGDAMAGQVQNPRGEVPFTATRSRN